MKTRNGLIIAGLLAMPMVFAQEVAQQVSNKPLNIDGYIDEKEEEVSDRELDQVKGELKKQQKEIVLNKEKTKSYQKLIKSTEKLAEVTEEYIDGKLEAQSQIDKYNKKIDCLLNNPNGPGCAEFVKKKPVGEQQDEVKVEAAATKKEEVVEAQREEIAKPIIVEQIVAPKVEEKKEKGLKLLPYAGVTNFRSDELSLESKYALGLRLESNVNSRFAVGVGLMNTQMDSQYTSGVYGGNYYSVYGTGREIQYNNTSVDFYSKIFLIEEAIVKPYIAGGVTYNRSRISYAKNDSSAVVNGVTYSNEAFVNHFISGKLMGGVEVSLAKNVGLNVELQYAKGMTGSIISDSKQNGAVNADQKIIESVSKEITTSSMTSVFAGLLVTF